MIPRGPLKEDTWADDPSGWWLEHVAFAFFGWAKRRPKQKWRRVVAMTIGTAFCAVMLFVGLPIVFYELARDTWRDMGDRP